MKGRADIGLTDTNSYVWIVGLVYLVQVYEPGDATYAKLFCCSLLIGYEYDLIVVRFYCGEFFIR